MPRYAIIARSEDGAVPMGTIVPASMAQPEDVVTILLEKQKFDPREFPDLARFLENWGLERGRLPAEGTQLRGSSTGGE